MALSNEDIWLLCELEAEKTVKATGGSYKEAVRKLAEDIKADIDDGHLVVLENDEGFRIVAAKHGLPLN